MQFIIPTQTAEALTIIANHKESEFKFLYYDSETHHLIAIPHGNFMAFANIHECQDMLQEFPEPDIKHTDPPETPIPIPAKILANAIKASGSYQKALLPIVKTLLVSVNTNDSVSVTSIDKDINISTFKSKTHYRTLPDYKYVFKTYDESDKDSVPIQVNPDYLNTITKMAVKVTKTYETPNMELTQIRDGLIYGSVNSLNHTYLNPEIRFAIGPLHLPE